ncbi:MAG TPA: response regulator [Polyangiales bacterium]|nr:response regulator [Polyangiales bacterium]
MSQERNRLEAAVDLAVRIAAGDLDARLLSSDADDGLDALVTSLNMLAEELGHERRTRERAQELLADELDTYEHAPALFCSLDGETLVVEKCNESLADALARPKQQILGSCVLDLCEPKCHGDAVRLLQETEVGVRPSHGELTLVTASNRRLVVATSVSRVRAGERSRLRIVWKDVTAERHLEAQLQQAQKMEAIGRLSGGVAHDFNNILAVITTAAEFVQELLAANELPIEDAQLILEASARGAALTSDLLAFSRQRVVRPVPTDVRVVVRDTERMIARLVGEHIRVVTELTSEQIICNIDPSQVSQVLLNVAINGRDAMPEGGTLGLVVSRIELNVSDESERLELSPGSYALIIVSDVGVGMTPEVAAKAFDPFFTTKPLGKGTGLGLSMSYGIIRQAGGRIVIDSELGRGTKIKIYLPLVSHLSHHESVRPAATEAGSETILLVEDDNVLRSLGKRILERGGYRVLVAANGREALELLERLPDKLALVVTDVMMPELGGQQLASRLREIRPETRVLFVSGFTANAILTQGVLKPGVAFLPKPFTPAALRTAVRRVLDG